MDKKIKCFVISYNRLTMLKQCVEVLRKNPRLDITIVDNHSTYNPLCEYLFDLMAEGIPVYGANKNFGHTVVWDCGLVDKLTEPYIITDCDVIPQKDGYLEILEEGMRLFPMCNKVGLGLRTHDIPTGTPLRSEVIDHELSLYRKETHSKKYVRMAVDTTFALYRAEYCNSSVWGYEENHNGYDPMMGCQSLRTTFPNDARHLSWYLTEADLRTEEYKYYLSSISPRVGHWSNSQKHFLKTP